MTAIVGLVHEGRVYIGADSAGVAGSDLVLRADSKVFTNGPMVCGFTSSFRMGQVLRHGFIVPPLPRDDDLDRYMVIDFVDAVRATLTAAGYAKDKDGRESGGTFLVGLRGRLFEIDDDYQVGVPADGYASVGSGAEKARGALFATPGMPPKKRVLLALEAAEHFTASVRAPFIVVKEPR